MLAMGPCVCCKAMFSFNPERVPSITVNGQREPVCRGCMETANEIRVQRGDKPHPIMAGAYEAEPV